MIEQIAWAALLVPWLASGAAPAPLPAPQFDQQTSRRSARQQMAACQNEDQGLTGAAKEAAVQNRMRGG